MAAYVGDKISEADAQKVAEFEARVDPADRDAVALLDEMKGQLKKVGRGRGWQSGGEGNEGEGLERALAGRCWGDGGWRARLLGWVVAFAVGCCVLRHPASPPPRCVYVVRS
jgi:hypothetical protein